MYPMTEGAQSTAGAPTDVREPIGGDERSQTPGTDTARRSSPGEVLARNLIIFRARRKFSQAALAERAGLSRTTISNIERGDVSPTVDLVGRLASALGARLDEMFVDDVDDDVADDDELDRLAATRREDAVDAHSLIVAIDEAAGHSAERYSRAGRPRLAR